MKIHPRGTALFWIGFFLATLALGTLPSCGGNGTALSGGGIGGTGKSVGAITARGSITVNGVEFETLGAAITLDDTPAIVGDGVDDGLKIGMIAKVSGDFESGGTSGSADIIEVDDEVQGKIESIDTATSSFVVLQQTVFVDENTIYANVLDLAQLQSIFDSNPLSPPTVEVHGQRDDLGTIRASRVELLTGPRLQEEDELTGFVSGLSGTTFFIGTLQIDFGGGNTAILPPGASPADIVNGIVVEVHGNLLGPTFFADRVDIEDLEDAIFDPVIGDEFEIEGFISGFTQTPGVFFVGGRLVRTTPSTRVEGGLFEDLGNGVKVEVEGNVIAEGITLVVLVEKIKIKDSLRMEATDTSVTTATETEATIFGKTVNVIPGFTQNVRYSADPNRGLVVRGFSNADGTITALRIRDKNVSAGNEVIQGPVDSFNRTARLLDITGITVDAFGVAEDNFEGSDDQPLGHTRFFDILENTTGVVVVKARGTFDGDTTLLADRVAIK